MRPRPAPAESRRDTPAPPCAWIARSSTRSAMRGATTLICAISDRAALLPTVSIRYAARSVSSRACSISMRESAMSARIVPCSASGLPNATRVFTRAHISSSARSADADQPHAVVNPARARAVPARSRSRGPRRAACSTPARARSRTRSRRGRAAHRRNPNTGSMRSMRDARRVHRHQDHRLLLMRRRVGVALAHEDRDPAARVAGAGDPPLAAVDDVVVAVAHDASTGCWWRRTTRRPARSSRSTSGSRRRAAARATAASARRVP